MAHHAANLDALIKREDFKVISENRPSAASLSEKLKATELESLTFVTLRKPDFQRETARWSPEKIAELIQCFVDGELIPSVILWRSEETGYLFVIDGAHRLSALIAWVHDDYGDKAISKKFFSDTIPPEQLDAAKFTRELIEKSIGSYESLKNAAQNPEGADPKTVKRARNLSSFSLQLQWVNGDADKAEDAFFKINQKAEVIDPTELKMIEARRKPNAIAARAIIRSGVGHKYWSSFAKETQSKIEEIAKEIYDILFSPPLENIVKSLDLPIAGRGYSADGIQMVFNLVNLAAGLSLTRSDKKLPDDNDGTKTLEYLKKVRRISYRICSDNNCSLGMHPAVYFYSETGKFSPTAFLATAALMQKLENSDGFFRFTKNRSKFEAFLLAHKYFINQVVVKLGSKGKSYNRLVRLYEQVLAGLDAQKTSEEIVADLLKGEFRFLKLYTPEDVSQPRSNFKKEEKSGAYIKRAMPGVVTCAICEGLIHRNAITTDHIVRKEDGGLGHLDNAQVTHPYCNTGYKEKLNSLEKSVA